MTTPLQYLAFWHKQEEVKLGYSKNEAQVVASICYDVDYYIFKKIGNKEKDSYLDYFLQFNSFEELCFDLTQTYDSDLFSYFEEHLKEISLTFEKRFPIEKNRLKKMWNLKPLGFSKSAVYS